MSDSFTQTTHVSWFTRIKNALGGVVTGILLVVAALVLLFWNEGRAVKTATALAEGAGIVVAIDPSNFPAEASGKLVHFSGELTPSGMAQDPMFEGIKAPEGALRLERKVEMYQWQESKKTETRKKLGGGEEKVTTYNYEKIWADRSIDSGNFKEQAGHRNPPMDLKPQTFSVESGTVGRITLKGDDIANLGKAQALSPDETMRGIIQKQFADGRSAVISGDAIVIRASQDGATVGDLRISYLTADADKISVIGKLDTNTIIPFQTSNGRQLSMFRDGTLDAKAMFDDAIASNTMWTWAMRFGGFLAMMLGFNMIFSIVGVLGDVIPFIGDVFRFATGLAAFALAAILSTLVIGIAWIYFRPVIGITIIVLGIVLAVAALYLGKTRARKEANNQSIQPA